MNGMTVNAMRPETLFALRRLYPRGTRVRLVQMDDRSAPPVGTLGTVDGVDALGDLMVTWDNGSHLNVVRGVDRVEFEEGYDNG